MSTTPVALAAVPDTVFGQTIEPTTDPRVAAVAEALWLASNDFGLARTWDEEKLIVRADFERRGRVAIDALERLAA